MPSTVSVIVANYSYGRFVAEAIDSVLAQRASPDEILVIDDASTDESREVLRSYEHRVRVVYNPVNLGIVGNFRKAVDLTSGDYIAFLGADNRMRSEYVERCRAALGTDHAVAVAYTDMLVFGSRAGELMARVARDPDYRVTPAHWSDGEEYFYWGFPEPTPAVVARLGSFNFMHGSSMYRRSAYRAVGGYQSTARPEDGDLFARMLQSGWKATHVPFPLIEYRQHSPDQANTIRIRHAELASKAAQRRRLPRLKRGVRRLVVAIIRALGLESLPSR